MGLRLAQQFQQLRDIRCDPPRLVFGEQLGGRTPAGLLLEIDIGKLLVVAVAHDQAREISKMQNGKRRSYGSTLPRRSSTHTSLRVIRLRN
jgi:hypothetical protein